MGRSVVPVLDIGNTHTGGAVTHVRDGRHSAVDIRNVADVVEVQVSVMLLGTMEPTETLVTGFAQRRGTIFISATLQPHVKPARRGGHQGGGKWPPSAVHLDAQVRRPGPTPASMSR